MNDVMGPNHDRAAAQNAYLANGQPQCGLPFEIEKWFAMETSHFE